MQSLQAEFPDKNWYQLIPTLQQRMNASSTYERKDSPYERVFMTGYHAPSKAINYPELHDCTTVYELIDKFNSPSLNERLTGYGLIIDRNQVPSDQRKFYGLRSAHPDDDKEDSDGEEVKGPPDLKRRKIEFDPESKPSPKGQEPTSFLGVDDPNLVKAIGEEVDKSVQGKFVCGLLQEPTTMATIKMGRESDRGLEVYHAPWQGAMRFALKVENKHRFTCGFANEAYKEFTTLACELSCDCEECHKVTAVKIYVPEPSMMIRMSETTDWAFDHLINSYVTMLRHHYRDPLADRKMILVHGKYGKIYVMCSSRSLPNSTINYLIFQVSVHQDSRLLHVLMALRR